MMLIAKLLDPLIIIPALIGFGLLKAIHFRFLICILVGLLSEFILMSLQTARDFSLLSFTMGTIASAIWMLVASLVVRTRSKAKSIEEKLYSEGGDE